MKPKIHQVWENQRGERFFITAVNEHGNFFYCKCFNGNTFGAGSAWFKHEYVFIG